MSVKLIIELGDNQKITIAGPLENKLLCFGMLEWGKILVKEYEPKRVITPTLVPPGMVTPLRSN